MILIEEDFLNYQTCDELIRMYQNSESSFETFRDIYVKNLFYIDRKASLQMGIIFTSYLAARGVQVYPELIQAVIWPEEATQAIHIDKARTTTALTSITYLNDNFEGGETYFENGISVKPKKGKTVFFDGMKYPHGVHPVRNGKRFVLANWYSKDIENLYI